MILFLHGDEYAAAGYVSSAYAWADEDHWHRTRGKRAHPDNIPFGFGYRLANLLHIGFHSAVQRDSTVDSIIQDYLAFAASVESHTVVISWSTTHCAELDKIKLFSNLLSTKGIEHLFINSESRLNGDGARWLWNPQTQDIKSWAKSKNFLQNQHLNKDGHCILANELMLQLTNQMNNLILRT